MFSLIKPNFPSFVAVSDSLKIFTVFSKPTSFKLFLTFSILALISLLFSNVITISERSNSLNCLVSLNSFANLIISLMRNLIPSRIRIIVQLAVVATLVTLVSEFLKAYI